MSQRKIIPMPLPGTDTQEIQPWEKEHAAVARKAAAESFVLLKNEEATLPVPKGSRIALYGVGAVETIKGGTGSGDVNERYAISIAQGLREAGYILTDEEWLAGAEKAYREARIAWKNTIMESATGDLRRFFYHYASHPFIFPGGDPVPDVPGDTDTAVYVISRIAGEGADRNVAPGDYLLTEAEEAAIHTLCRQYARVVLLLNVGGAIDLSILDREENIKAVLLIGQPGMEGGRAVADVLSGDMPVSGKLTSTWACRYEDYPNAATFSHVNGNVQKEVYTEDIYVGYRYFDTFGIPARFGFGEGLSYTGFSLNSIRIEPEGKGRICVSVTVRNTGSFPGKEVVQVYLLLPDKAEGCELRRLAAFGKTKLLSPGEETVVRTSFTPEEAAGYDEARSLWTVAPGRYGICIGTSLRDSRLYGFLNVAEEKILARAQAICVPSELPDRLKADPARRAEAAAKIPVESEAVLDWNLSGVETITYVYGNPDESGDEAAELVSRLSEEQLIALATGDPSKGQGSTIGSAGVSVPGSAAETSRAGEKDGIASIILADGPAGLRLNQTCYIQNGHAVMQGFLASIEHGFFSDGDEPEGDRRWQYCTAIPVGSVLSQSWDPEVLRECGDIVGDEMERFNVTLWLAPGMNIYRNPLCGRNFEYYSEDPLLSGRMATAMTRGVQQHPGCGTTIKHFACNNQEDNRKGSDSILSERALREIYLRGFGIAIRESQPLSIMTSYNLINGIHAANNHDLCTKVARNEFGFKGTIMTDWTTTNDGPDCTAAGCVRAGNDLTMPGQPGDMDSIREALKDGSLALQDLKDCVTRTVRVILQSRRYEES